MKQIKINIWRLCKYFLRIKIKLSLDMWLFSVTEQIQYRINGIKTTNYKYSRDDFYLYLNRSYEVECFLNWNSYESVTFLAW